MLSFSPVLTGLVVVGTFASQTLAFRGSNRSIRKPDLCPSTCTSYDPTGWYVYPTISRVGRCNESMILDFNIHNDLSDRQNHSTIYACKASDLDQLQGETESITSVYTKKFSVNYELAGWPASTSASGDETSTALLQDIKSYLTGNIQKSEIFAYSNGIAIGAYVGKDVQFADNVDLAIEKLTSFLESASYGTAAFQYCGTDSDHTTGVIVSMDGDFSTVQNYVQSWRKGNCVSGAEKNVSATGDLWVHKPDSSSSSTNTTLSVRSHHGDGHSHSHFHQRRSDSSLSAYDNGTCYTYYVQSGDSCWALGETYNLTSTEIDNYNNKTWAWFGCDNLQAGQSMCLSDGTPPYPLAIANAECGPQVPNTTFTSEDSYSWEELNPCPLNACCDSYGQCGTTPLYCDGYDETSTDPPGTDNCISNCGSTITNTAVEPDSYSKVGYYEASSANRSCLQMDPLSIDTSQWTHINFAFGNIEQDFSINVNGMEDLFEHFMELSDVKRLISFGGWDFSTGTDTYMIFRNGVKSANRATFAQNVANYVEETGLDGVDFDWEYPSEPDIEGIPAGSDDEADNYLEFLKEVKEALPSGTLLSVTLPSSYWYLKPFPVSNMSNVVDYFNYMVSLSSLE